MEHNSLWISLCAPIHTFHLLSCFSIFRCHFFHFYLFYFFLLGTTQDPLINFELNWMKNMACGIFRKRQKNQCWNFGLQKHNVLGGLQTKFTKPTKKGMMNAIFFLLLSIYTNCLTLSPYAKVMAV